jgi:hypothetical protein
MNREGDARKAIVVYSRYSVGTEKNLEKASYRAVRS